MTILNRPLLAATTVLLAAATVLGAYFLFSSEVVEANNPPSTLLGTVAVDPGQSPAATDPLLGNHL